MISKDPDIDVEIEQRFNAERPDSMAISTRVLESIGEEKIIRIIYQSRSGPPLLPSPYAVYRWHPKQKQLVKLSSEEAVKYRLENRK